MSINLQIINPIEYRGWDDLLLQNPSYSFFHSSHWAKVLHESYHYKPLYFTLINNGKLKVTIPLMEIKSLLTGQRGVSLPFTDYCDPLMNGTIQSKEVFDYLIEYGKRAGWRYIEIRDSGDFLQDLPPSSYYYDHTLNLSENEKRVFSNFRSSTKRNIKKAIKEEVEVNICNSLESIKEFCRLNCITRKNHGLPPQPYYFFKKVYDHIISKNQGFVMLAYYNKTNIAGAVYFHFGDKAFFKYGASDRKYHHLRPNNLVMWEAIKWYCQKGYKSFCFGKTETENKGLIQFKAGWGTEEKIIKYYRYDLKKSAFISGESYVSGPHNKVFNKMPIPLLKIVGSLFYKHMI